MEKALVSLALETEDKVAERKEPRSPQTSTVPQTSAAQVPTALKGVSQSLLDRVCTLGGGWVGGNFTVLHQYVGTVE